MFRASSRFLQNRLLASVSLSASKQATTYTMRALYWTQMRYNNSLCALPLQVHQQKRFLSMTNRRDLLVRQDYSHSTTLGFIDQLGERNRIQLARRSKTVTAARYRLGLDSTQLSSPETYLCEDDSVTQAGSVQTTSQETAPSLYAKPDVANGNSMSDHGSWLEKEKKQYEEFVKVNRISSITLHSSSKNKLSVQEANQSLALPSDTVQGRPTIEANQPQLSQLWKLPDQLAESGLSHIFSSTIGLSEDGSDSKFEPITPVGMGHSVHGDDATYAPPYPPHPSRAGHTGKERQSQRHYDSSMRTGSNLTSKRSFIKFPNSRRSFSTLKHTSNGNKVLENKAQEAFETTSATIGSGRASGGGANNTGASGSASGGGSARNAGMSASAFTKAAMANFSGSPTTVDTFNSTLIGAFGTSSTGKLADLLNYVDDIASDLRPRHIVDELNRHIVSQDAAKRAVAIALRNRWRRGKLPESLKEDVTPTNLLLVGPTGSGKSAIARRLAKFIHAPFIKVEATKFTEVGFIGRDVETIIKDLVEVGVAQVRQQIILRHACLQQYWVENVILSKLFPHIELESFDKVMRYWKPNKQEVSPLDSLDDHALRAKLRNGDFDDALVELESNPYLLANLANGFFQSVAVTSVSHPTKAQPNGNTLHPLNGGREKEPEINADLQEPRNIAKPPVQPAANGYHTSKQFGKAASDASPITPKGIHLSLGNETVFHTATNAAPVFANPVLTSDTVDIPLSQPSRHTGLTHFVTVREAKSVLGNAVPVLIQAPSNGAPNPSEFAPLNFFNSSGGAGGSNILGSSLQNPMSGVDRGSISSSDLSQAAIRLVEQRGIVFIDEIDKLCRSSKSGPASSDVSDEGVQRDLLPIIEGTTVSTSRGPVKTDHILFIAAGAFHAVKPTDLLAELQGRLPIKVKLEPLSEDDMHRVLTEPEHNLLMQQSALIGTEGVELHWKPEAIRLLARRATELNRSLQNLGARRLQAVVESVVEELSFKAPELSSGSRVEITEEFVDERLKELLQSQDLAKFIL